MSTIAACCESRSCPEPGRACGWCRRRLRRGQDLFCSRRCYAKARQCEATRKAIFSGKSCRCCRRALRHGRKVYCSLDCRTRFKRPRKRCWVCCQPVRQKYASYCGAPCRKYGRTLRRTRTEELKRRCRPPKQRIFSLVPTQVCVVRRHCDSLEIQRLGWLQDEFPSRNGALVWKIGQWDYAEARSWRTAEARLRRLADRDIELMQDLPRRMVPHVESKARRRTPGIIVGDVSVVARGLTRVPR